MASIYASHAWCREGFGDMAAKERREKLRLAQREKAAAQQPGTEKGTGLVLKEYLDGHGAETDPHKPVVILPRLLMRPHEPVS